MQRRYLVHERLVGEAQYEVEATSKAEALAKVRRGEHEGMLDSRIEHTGRGRVDRIGDERL
jgi:hypothetical protein